jgi:hypothetical protein
MLEIAAYFDTSLATFSALTFEKKSSSLVAMQCNAMQCNTIIFFEKLFIHKVKF